MFRNLIYDVGMNNGDDTAHYLRSGFRVIAIEANPKLATMGAERFANEIKSGQLKILNIGIAAEEGELPFWICETFSEWSSFDRSIASRDGSPHHEIRIPCKRFRMVLNEFGIPYYLKIDIEGNDAFCVRDLDAKALPKFISVEAADLSLLTLLLDHGFKRFKCISQFNFLPLEVPPAKEQRRYELAQWMYRTKNPFVRAFRALGGRGWIDQHRNRYSMFPRGSSGPFGEQLPGRWLGYDEMKATYEHYLCLFQAKERSLFWNEANYSFWTDFHARHD